MKWLMIASIAGLVLMAFLLKWLFWRDKKPSRFPYQKHSMLFSADERVFFRALQGALAAEYEIFGKIRVCDIIVPKGSSGPRVKSAFGRIEGRHFDFVVCEKKNLAVACAVQLHDHAAPDRLNDEDPLMAICENVGLPLLRFSIKADYSAVEIRESLRKAMAREPFIMVETGGRKEPRISNIDDMKF